MQSLGTTGIAGVLAGCLGGDENGEENGGENGDDGNGDDANGTGNGNPEPANFEVSDLLPGDDDVTRGDSVEVTATIGNTGDQEATQTVELVFDGESEASEEVTLAGGESSDVFLGEIATADLETGDYEYTVSTDDDDASATLSVGGALGDDPDPLISLEASTVGVGERTLSATLDNPYAVALEDGEVELEVPEGWELAPESGTSFDALAASSSQEATWELTVPNDAEGDYELTAHVSYASADEAADVTTGLPIAVDVWEGVEFVEALHFEDVWENGIEDRQWVTPDGEEWGGQGPTNWYKYELDLSAYLPADAIQFQFEDPYPEDGWGPSLWDTRIRADGEEIHYVRAVHDEDEGDYLYEDNSMVDEHSHEHQMFRFADGQSYWIYGFDVPEDAEELSAEFTMRNGFVLSTRAGSEADVGKDDIGATMTPVMRVPYTGGGVAEMESLIPETEPRAFLLAPEFDLPHGPTYAYADEAAVEGRDDISADFYTGYDEDHLYLRADVTDDEHVSVAGGDMWQADSLQFAAGTGDEYGPEYGLAHVDGEADLHRWVEGQAGAGPDVIDVTTSRDGDTTIYEIAIPWEALYDEPKGEPGDNGPFSVLVNESDDAGERDAVLGWTLPGITEEKNVDALGTLLLENPVGDAAESGE